MKLTFYKCSPAENMTVLVWDPVAQTQYAEVANEIMKESHLHAEQVGFVTKPVQQSSGAIARLEMMGGEFCANATLSLAAVLSIRKKRIEKTTNSRQSIQLETSGITESVICYVDSDDTEYKRKVTLQLPLPEKISVMDFSCEGEKVEGVLVELPGIAHVIVDAKKINDPEMFFSTVQKQLESKQFDALGVMVFDDEKCFMKPLVWVRATDSLFWEKGCGSGTAALGIAKATQIGESVKLGVQQPGGTLGVNVDWKEGQAEGLWLSGEVKIVAEGTAYLEGKIFTIFDNP